MHDVPLLWLEEEMNRPVHSAQTLWRNVAGHKTAGEMAGQLHVLF
jgi:hypothetical protein